MAVWKKNLQTNFNQKCLVNIVILLTFVINIVLANNPPKFVIENVIIISEDTPIGTIIGNLTGEDEDGPLPLVFDRTTKETQDLVELSEPRDINPKTRVVDIILKVQLDRDYEPGQRQLYFKVSDSKSEVRGQLTLLIKDVNDDIPRFVKAPYKATVNESVAPGSIIFDGVKGEDRDSGRGGTFQFSMEIHPDVQVADADYGTTFELDPIMGNIKLLRPLDYEKHKFYQYKLNIVDGLGLQGKPVDFVVNVLDVQDTPPYFVNLPYSAEVKESVSVSTSILQVSALDGDRGVPNSLTYSFVQEKNIYGRGDYEKFNIDKKTGVITVNSSLDRDAADVRNTGGVYAMYVEAKEVVPTDQINNGATLAKQLVTITVEDINDNTPQFDRINYDATILENMQDGVPIAFTTGSMRCADLDQGTNSHFVLSIEQNGQPYHDFSPLPQEVYSESTILIRVNNSNSLDYEKSKTIVFQIVAKEVDTINKRSSTATVTVQVEDMNDNVPIFPKETYLVEVREDTLLNTVIETLQATDADDGLNGQITYSIRGGNNKFSINPTLGEISIASNLDREATEEYYLTGEARDGGGLRTPVEVKIIVLDVNDNHPVFKRQEYEAILRESDSDFLRPLFVEATDDDQAGSNNSIIRYRIPVDETRPINLENSFSINPISGHLVVTKPIDFEQLDASFNSIIIVPIEAYDLGDKPLSSIVNVSITLEDRNDNAPKFEAPTYSATVPENSTEGTVILQVKATDLDGTSPNNEFIYRIESGALDKFRVNFATGQLLVETGARLNREDKDVYIMNISAIDKGTPPQTGRCTVTVRLTDVNDEMPVFTPTSQTKNIMESANIGDALLTYGATDADLNSLLKYEIVKEDIKAYNERNEEVDVNFYNITDYFAIAPNNGIVLVASKLDREVAERFLVKIMVTDLEAWQPELQTATAMLTVILDDANDNSPVFKPSTHYSVKISEGQDIESEALRVEATDPDKNQKVKFTLSANGQKYFKIDENAGIIKIKQKLDRELEPTVTFSVVAEDDGADPMSSTATVSITVLDINDNAAVFRPHPLIYTVGEDAGISTEVGRVTADDADAGAFGTVFYKLEGIDSDGTFVVEEKDGIVTVGKDLDREKKAEYSLVVVATDNKQDVKDQRSNRTTITIRLDDINDNVPVFESVTGIIPNIPESSPIDSNVFTVEASDIDAGDNGTVLYFFGSDTNATNAKGESIFRIDENSGTIFVDAELRSAIGLRYVTVEAQDRGSPPLGNSSVFYFRIADVNDDPPTFQVPDPNNPFIVTDEGEPINTTVITLVAIDDDEGENGQIIYSILETQANNDWQKFTLDPQSGRISNKVVLDRETQSKYELRIRASDNGIPRSYNTDLTMIIQVRDKNDQEPEFDHTSLGTPYKMSVKEETSTECVGNVALAVDRDVNENFTIICYYIYMTSLQDTFSLKPSGGELCLKKSIDREMVPYVYLVIQASSNCYDNITAPLIATDKPPIYDTTDLTLLWVNISVTDINDNPPKFKRKELSLGITKTIQFGSFIFNLKNEVVDLDSATFGVNKFTQIGDVNIQPQELQNEIDGQVPFILFPNGSVKTNTYFRPTMYGYFIMSLNVMDKGGKNDTANLRISLINDNQRVKVIFRRKVAEVGNFRDEVVSELQNITGYRIVVDDIRTHINESGKPELDKTDMFIHGEDLVTNEVIPAVELLRAIDYSEERLVDLLNGYNIVKIMETNPAPPDDDTVKQLRMALILVSVILGALVIILIIAFYTSRRKYQRKLKAATAMAYVANGNGKMGSQDSDLYKLEMPGTNIHSYENANPIYLEKILLAEGEEDGRSSSANA